MATTFFLTSMALAYFAAQVGEPEGLMDEIETPVLPLGSAGDEPAAGDLPTPLSGEPAAGGGEASLEAPDSDLPPLEMAPETTGGSGAEGDLPPIPLEED
jgi:preprotein translocase subunit SecG